MKKVVTLFLTVVLLLGTLPAFAATQREVWVTSPSVTCGVTEDEIMINKAIKSGNARFYNLASISDRNYLCVLEDQRKDGGYNGTTDTSYLTYYSLLVTDGSFIVLGKASMYNEYYWDRYEEVLDISEKIDEAYYTQKGYNAPYYIVNPLDKYHNSKVEEYNEYVFIDNKGGIACISDWDDYKQARFPLIYDRKLYTGQTKYYSDEYGYDYYLDDDTTLATKLSLVGMKNNKLTEISSSLVERSIATEANGYVSYPDAGFKGNMSIDTLYKLPDNSDKYFRYNYVLNESDNMYYCEIKICQMVSGIMTVTDTKTVSMGTSSKPTSTPEIIENLNEETYNELGMSMPIVKIGNAYILKNGEIVSSGNTEISGKTCIYNNRLAVVTNMTTGGYIYYKNSAGKYVYWQRISYLDFKNGKVTAGPEMDIEVGQYDNLDGYYRSHSSFTAPTGIKSMEKVPITEWWKHCFTKYFPDGRYASGHWLGLGNSIYEIWYDIYSADGTLLATGPTGFTALASSPLYTSGIQVYAINNTKIIMCVSSLETTWHREFYRSSVATENDEGIIEVPMPIGKKNIVSPDNADTTPAKEVVDFAADSLELGFNVKNNVLETDNFTPELREQINTIRLDSIIFLTNEEYISGKQNTGITLDEFDEYDFDFGDTSVRFYSNGQYLCWYCDEPYRLNKGTYNVTYRVGDITVCTAIKVIDPPTNNSTTTVVF